MGNKQKPPPTKFGTYEVMFDYSVRVDLNNFCYSSEFTRNIILFDALFRQGYLYSFDNANGSILVYKNDPFIFKSFPCNGMYENTICVNELGDCVYNIDSSNSLDKACLWNCRLGHINKKRIVELQKDGVLKLFDLKSDDQSEYYLLSNMTKSPFTGTCERCEGLFDLIYTNVCATFISVTKDANCF